MIQCRNTLVAVRLIEKEDQKVGKIIVPLGNETYCEAEVLAVGPGCVAAGGGRSETHDLKVGQRVWINHKRNRMQGNVKVGNDLMGIQYTEGEEKYYLFEEKNIFAVIAQPVNTGVSE